MGRELSLGELLANAQPGDDQTISQLLPVVYGELRALASSYLEHKPGHTLQPTALVHEAYVKLVGPDRAWSGRDHFIATAAIAMRQILIDHARRKNADKRGGGAVRASVDLGNVAGSSRDMRVLELDELLTQLAQADARAARIAEMYLFGGMTQEQMARVLGVSRATVVTDWQFARAWLASKAKERGDA